MIKPFWIVVCDFRPATAIGTPRELRPAAPPYRHATEESAIREAARLTRACVSQSFFVFKAVSLVKPAPDVVVRSLETGREHDFDDEIPF